MTPKLVEDFYERIWNDGNPDAVAELLTAGFSFRSSPGQEMGAGKHSRITFAMFARRSRIISVKIFPASPRKTRLSQAATWRHFEVMSRRGNSFNGWEQRYSGSTIR